MSLSRFYLFFSLMFLTLVVDAVTPVIIKKETTRYIIDIKYPQDFDSVQTNSVIKTYIEGIQKSFMIELSEDVDTPADAPGKTGLNITYDIPYHSPRALSVRFNVSIYHRGAAHPSNNVVVANFINGHQVQLDDLFVKGSHYLQPVAEMSQQEITQKKISDEKWIKEGTKPILKNYNVWYFTPTGIAIIFNSYQVAAYVYGEQTIKVPLAKISSYVKPGLSKIVWGH